MTAPSLAPRTLFAADALLPAGWARNVLLSWDENGRLTEVLTDVDLQSGEAGEAEDEQVAHGSGGAGRNEKAGARRPLGGVDGRGPQISDS